MKYEHLYRSYVYVSVAKQANLNQLKVQCESTLDKRYHLWFEQMWPRSHERMYTMKS